MFKSDELIVGVVEAFVNAMESKDVFLRGHSARVGALAGALAHEMEMPQERAQLVELAGRLHDVGKIGIREAVLHKTEPLTDAERYHIREHVHIGMEILAPLSALGDALTFIEQHHERLDGSGYPHALRDVDISDGGRILAVADAFDALTSFRPYRAARSHAEALDTLQRARGTSLDAPVLDALNRLLARRDKLRGRAEKHHVT